MRMVLAVIGAIVAIVVGYIPGVAVSMTWRHVAGTVFGVCDPKYVMLDRCTFPPSLLEHLVMEWLPYAVACLIGGYVGGKLTFWMLKWAKPRAVTIGVVGAHLVLCILVVALFVADGAKLVFIVGRAAQDLAVIAGWMIAVWPRLRAQSFPRQAVNVF